MVEKSISQSVTEMFESLQPRCCEGEGCHELRFRGRDVLLVGCFRHGGAVALPEEYENFAISSWYLSPDGVVHRYGLYVGRVDELEGR